MHGVDLIRFIIGIIGNIISGLLFVSPMPTFWRIIKNKSTEQFHPYPYLAAMMNCILWIFYGQPYVHPDSTLVVTINSFGLLMEVIFLGIFWCFAEKKYKKIIPLVILAELALTAVVVAISVKLLHTTTTRSMVVGIICVVFGIIMYASPLSNMRRVYKMKSAEYMPFWLCVAGFSNGAVWFTYAFLKKFDPYIAVGNGIGGAFGAFQLFVFAYYTFYYGNKNVSNDDEVKKPGDVQLADAV